MKTLLTAEELRTELAAQRRVGRRIGFVPTMGAFHDGHLSLMRRARTEGDVVVVSLFVNPAQFNDGADLAAYPRDARGDAALAAQAGIDYLFTPSAEEIYPAGFATTVSVAGITEALEGRHRGRSHFDGVTTIVAKLFNIVGPDVAYFGQKDAQQVLVIRRMVEDLAFPVELRVCPTVRDRHGLALSSRNGHLSDADRTRATAVHRSLAAVRDAIAAGESDPAAARALGVAELEASGVVAEYLELVNPEALTPLDRLDGDVLALVAARVGTTRLIDNELIPTAGSTHNGRP
jgi:pantoate--beta-alanine ligase